MIRCRILFAVVVPLLLLITKSHADSPRELDTAAMRAVHARFKGKPGTFAHFGDSITDSLAFWTPLLYDPKGMSPEMIKARKLVMEYMQKECWRDWKGADYGNLSGTTIEWAEANVDKWLKKLNPEVVLLMFGTNDLRDTTPAVFARRTRSVVKRCLDNGSIVILTTLPPRAGMVDKSRQFADIVRRIAADEKMPLIDFQAEILKRRPNDWDGSRPEFKETAKADVYQVPTLIAGDGIHPSNPEKYADYSEESLRHNGYVLRNYLTLMTYADVVRTVLKPEKK